MVGVMVGCQDSDPGTDMRGGGGSILYCPDVASVAAQHLSYVTTFTV